MNRWRRARTKVFSKSNIPSYPSTTDEGRRLAKWVQDWFKFLQDKGNLYFDQANFRAAFGIVFPTSQGAASIDPNTLDDYAEGTWTPADGSGATLSFTVDHATYTKIGRLVHGQAKLTYPPTVSGATAAISGLPFTSAKQTSCPIGSDGGSVVWGLISGTSISPEPVNGGGILNSALTGKTLWINFSYYV